jgi:beta-aspartyl-peptidase (threonine type)
MKSSYAIAIHGGAGTILKSAMTDEKEAAYTSVLNQALTAAENLLKKSGSAIDAVEKAVNILEDSDLFNAGLGAVFTHAGTHELDASIMDGRDRKAGAVAGVQRIKNPISLCRTIMDQSEHVFLMADGAEAFAEEHGMVLVDPSYFSTDFRKTQLLSIRDSGKTQLDHSVEDLKKFGTVGAVALDVHGNLAAATSTGGITNKRYGRIGDTPVIGAGTYAENGVCAVSSTGYGEYFLRSVAAYEVAALMKYGGLSLEEATKKVIHEMIPKMGGDGGLISVDSHGNIATPFNTEGMYRAWAKSGQKAVIEIYR